MELKFKDNVIVDLCSSNNANTSLKPSIEYLNLMARGDQMIKIPRCAVDQIPFLAAVVEGNPDPDNFIIKLDISPDFLKDIIDFLVNCYKVSYLKQILEEKYDKNNIDRWLKNLSMDELLMKLYCPNSIKIVNWNKETEKLIVVISIKEIIKNISGSHDFGYVYGFVLPDGSYIKKGPLIQDTVYRADLKEIIIDGKLDQYEFLSNKYRVILQKNQVIVIQGWYFVKMDMMFRYCECIFEEKGIKKMMNMFTQEDYDQYNFSTPYKYR